MIKFILKLTIALIVFASTLANAQEFQGKALYQSKVVMGDEIQKRLDSSKMPEDRKAFMLKMIKKRLERVYELDFNKTTSIYKEFKTLATPSETNRFNRPSNDVFFKDIKAKKVLNKKDLFGKIFLINDQLQPINWKLEKESKMIGKHLCFKATAEKVVKNEMNMFKRFARKSKTATDSTLKKTKVVAWYTPEIPVSNGPADYYGLPGLVLEVNAGKYQLLCTKIVLNPKEKVEISAPSKGKEISQKEFDKIMKEKITEMKEKYKNNRKKGGSKRGHGRF